LGSRTLPRATHCRDITWRPHLRSLLRTR